MQSSMKCERDLTTETQRHRDFGSAGDCKLTTEAQRHRGGGVKKCGRYAPYMDLGVGESWQPAGSGNPINPGVFVQVIGKLLEFSGQFSAMIMIKYKSTNAAAHGENPRYWRDYQ